MIHLHGCTEGSVPVGSHLTGCLDVPFSSYFSGKVLSWSSVGLWVRKVALTFGALNGFTVTILDDGLTALLSNLRNLAGRAIEISEMD